MVNVLDEGIILEKTNHEFESKAVLNPACIEIDGLTHMLYRAISSANISSIGYCKLKDNKVINRFSEPVLYPEHEWEKQGVEDPRVVFLDGLYYLFYTAYDGKNALVAYATGKDLPHFEKKGIITPKITYDEAENLFQQSKLMEKYAFFESYYIDKLGKDVLLFEKDTTLFPKKINGKFALLHRILPGIQVIYFDDFSQLSLDYWKNYLRNLSDFVVLDPKYSYESRNIGGGCPPIETEDGWLLIYHAVEDTKEGRIYRASAALLDLENPVKVIARLKEPLFSPTHPYQWQGITKHVDFPTGAVIRGNRLFIYYGAADVLIACKSVDLAELLRELKENPG